MLSRIRRFFTSIWNWIFGTAVVPETVVQPPMLVQDVEPPPIGLKLPDSITAPTIAPAPCPISSSLESKLFEQRPNCRARLSSIFADARLDELIPLRKKVVSKLEREVLEQNIERKAPVEEDEDPPMPDDFGRTCPEAISCPSAWFDDGPVVKRDVGSTAPHEDFFANFPNCKPPVR